MATYEVTGPDGHTYEVSAPDNAPESAVLAYAKIQFSKGAIPQFEQDAKNPAGQLTAGQRFAAGMGKAVADIGRGAYQFLNANNPTEAPKAQAAIDEARARDASLSATPEGMAGEIAGNLAVTAIPGAGLQGAATRAAGAVLPAAIAPTVGAAITGGAVTAATTPVATGESRAEKAGYGAAGAAAGDLAARGLARVAQPITQSPAVKRLLGEGVVPTPGQAAGGPVAQAEEKLQSVFGVGDIVKHGRVRAGEEFNKAALNRSVPAGDKVTEAGAAGLEQAKTFLSNAYDKVFAGKTVTVDPSLAQMVGVAKSVPALPLSAEGEKTFDAVLKKSLWDRLPQGSVPADKMKAEIIADLGTAARDLRSSSVASERAVGEAIGAARDAAQQWLAQAVSKGNPQTAAQIANIDKAYANRIAVGKAVERAKANGGVFTPNQLQTAAKTGALRPLANDAQEVLGSRVPNSGTIDRGTLAMLLGGGAAGANEYFGGPSYLTALAAAPVIYSRPGSRYMVGDLVPGQGALAELLRKLGPAASQVGRAVANE